MGVAQAVLIGPDGRITNAPLFIRAPVCRHPPSEEAKDKPKIFNTPNTIRARNPDASRNMGYGPAITHSTL
jgi:hypothetical protein